MHSTTQRLVEHLFGLDEEKQQVRDRVRKLLQTSQISVQFLPSSSFPSHVQQQLAKSMHVTDYNIQYSILVYFSSKKILAQLHMNVSSVRMRFIAPILLALLKLAHMLVATRQFPISEQQ
ncbi:Hypothetical_protein [Hexamita inflata]|uniref:Hypothetical_protein n=1 Tax=Hexamita inflata TaxID=28002 RepID=A0ABP1GX92_9EUKA